MGACLSDPSKQTPPSPTAETPGVSKNSRSGFSKGNNSGSGITTLNSIDSTDRDQSISQYSNSSSGAEGLTSINSTFQSSIGSENSDMMFPTGRILPQPNLRSFTLSELNKMTENFKADNVLGEGGFGKVFKGWVKEKTLAPSRRGHGKVVAVKKLKTESVQGWKEWQSEVIFLGKLSHPNLVKLLGYGWEGDEFFLVYEFMPKGSLENHLFRRGGSASLFLNWNQRLNIAVDAARGLAFLHTSDKKIIYRDFKASNILLDSNYSAKLSDFGLAKEGPQVGESHVTTQVMGTYGYVAPEYATTGHLYVKSDVYGFGVVLLELLTGQRALDMDRGTEQRNLVTWARPYLRDRKKFKQIMDPQLDQQYPSKVAFRVCQLAHRCVSFEIVNRPSMSDVVESLETIQAMEGETEEVKVKPPLPGARNPTRTPPLSPSPYHPQFDSTKVQSAYPVAAR